MTGARAGTPGALLHPLLGSFGGTGIDDCVELFDSLVVADFTRVVVDCVFLFDPLAVRELLLLLDDCDF